MAIRIRTKRLATSATNPRRVKRKTKKRRNMSDRQIRHFGTKRQKAALKAHHRSRTNARVLKVSRVRSKRRRHATRSPNPALIVTLGPAVNPKRRSSMPATKTRKRQRHVKASRPRRRRVAKMNPVRRRRRVACRTRRHRNASPRVVVRYRSRRNRRRSVRRRSNPDLFGARLGSKDSLKLIGGGITGVAATKFLPTLLPTQMLVSVANTNIGKTAISVAAAFAAGWAASKLDARFGQGVYFGGFMQATSVGLNAFVPSLYKTLGIGMGDFVPGSFPVPQNPVRQLAAPAHAVAPSGSRVTMSGLARAYQPAY
jgi:hypothetical protein